MKHDGKAEVNGVRYILVQQPPVNKTAHTCAGCVARHDDVLCERLPVTCTGGKRIWIEE